MSSLQLNGLSGISDRDGQSVTSISISGGRISAIGPSGDSGAESIDCSGLIAWPGFIDVHNHGAVGVDVNAATVDEMIEVGKFLAQHGVTAWMPTLVPDSDENYKRVIDVLSSVTSRQSSEPVAQVVGVHYEGVFANEKMCGALRPQFFKRFTGRELEGLPKLADGAHMTTFAPEVEGGIALAAELKREGWIGSIGHTRAGVEVLDKALSAGAGHITHFFNAMTGLHHRDVGVVGWALSNPEVTFDIIADGIHVNASMVELAGRTKTPEKVSLISDSVAPTGLGDGSFTVWDENITVENGQTRNERGSIAGSVITMLDAVRRMRSLGFSDREVTLMASRNPARLLGLERDRGSIEQGKRADIVLLDSEANVRLTIIGGVVAYTRL